MRVIGLLGGMSWESTAEYYRFINREVKRRLGPRHSARLLLYSVDFEEVERRQTAGEWERAGQLLAEEARRLERGGADFVLLCSNTMHKVAPIIEDAIDLPLVHIIDATAERVLEDGHRRVGLLGTRFTMEEAFYGERLEQVHGLQVLVPDASAREVVDRVIFEELVQGHIREESREEYLRIIGGLEQAGAEAVILGCTEIGLLVRPEHSPIRAYDTAKIHSQKAVDLALAEQA